MSRESIIGRRNIFVIIMTCAAVVSYVLWYPSYIYMNVDAGGWFDESMYELKTENLVDIGMVDFNGDNNLDIFTTNHNQRQFLLKNDGTGKHSDVLYEMGLAHSAKYPGLELSSKIPVKNDLGLYIYWHNSQLVLKWKPIEKSTPAKVKIVMSSPISVLKNGGFKLELVQSKNKISVTETTIYFDNDMGGEVRLKPEFIAIPVSFTISDKLPLHHVHVGQELIHPHSRQFDLALADRHGMAWADYDGDDDMDVYITRGGLKGHMDSFTEVFADELYNKTETGYKNVIRSTSIVKDSCPGYQVQWVDYNNDNRLDLYISCQRKNKNQLYKNEGAGRFTAVGTDLGVGVTKNPFNTAFLWIDSDHDGDLDLLLSENGELKLYIQTDIGIFENGESYQLPNVSKLTVSDYDLDGDLDIFAISPSGYSALLESVNDRFVQKDALTTGLPKQGLTANWVDYDNDGFPDLHVVPGGIYRQRNDHTFEETGFLEHKFPWSIYNVRCSWADIDNDGDRDLIMAIYYKETLWQQLLHRLTGQYVPLWDRELKQWNIRTFINNTESMARHNNWFQLKLVGREGNQQAIGALVSVKSGRQNIAAQVGQSEGSHLSQGHYRLYFGLGKEYEPIAINIRWPDGSKQEVDRILMNNINTLIQE